MNSAQGPRLILRVGPRKEAHRGKSLKIGIPRRVVRLATRRNRWKRLIRETLRRRAAGILVRHSLNFQVHTAVEPISYSEIEREILQLLHQSGAGG